MIVFATALGMLSERGNFGLAEWALEPAKGRLGGELGPAYGRVGVVFVVAGLTASRDFDLAVGRGRTWVEVVLEGVGICIGTVAVGVTDDGEGRALNALTAAGLIACGLVAGAAWPAAVPGTGSGRDKGTRATGLAGWLLFNGAGVERAAKDVFRVTFGRSLTGSPGDLLIDGLKNI